MQSSLEISHLGSTVMVDSGRDWIERIRRMIVGRVMALRLLAKYYQTLTAL
jgi:hypothetical protein